MECNFENCGYYIDDECTICGMGTDGEDTFCKYCKDNPNCYYKQLTELKAENEKLKALCDTYKTCYQAKHSDIKGLLFKYRQTLREIKAIAENGTKTEDYLLGQKYTDLVDEILQKITKTESEG